MTISRHWVWIIGLVGLLVGCDPAKEGANTVTLGTIAGPETQLMKVAQTTAKNQFDLTLKLVTFSDYVMPNRALAEGSIDANMFQHKPYLDAAIQSQGYDFVVVGKTFVYPMGVYSSTLKSLVDVPKGGKVAVPNDPSNEARALLLLQRGKLIQLKKGASVTATPQDIASNPKDLQFIELDAAQLPRVLEDVSLAVINTNYAVGAGLLPTRDAILIEKKDSPYANLIVVRKGEEKLEKIQQMVKAIQSEAVLAEADKLFQGQAIQAW